MLHRTDGTHSRMVYLCSRQSRLHLNLLVKMASACPYGVPFGHPVSLSATRLSCNEARHHEKAAHHAHLSGGHAVHAIEHAQHAAKAHIEEHGRK